MDRTAMECINLLPPSHAGISHVVVGGTSDTNSLFGVLNRCKTKMGSRMLEIWLRQPSVDLNTILYRQNAVGYMVEENGLGRDRLRDEGLNGLRGVDLDGLCQRLTYHGDGSGGTTKALECLYKLHLFADKQLPILMETLYDMVPRNNRPSEGEEKKESDNEQPEITGALQTTEAGLNLVLEELEKSVQLVEAVLDFDAAPREFLVKASFSEELEELRAELDVVEQELVDIHADMNQLWADVSGESVGQVRLESDGKDSSCLWQFRLPDSNKVKILQAELDGRVTIHRILKNGVYFSTKPLLQLGQRKHDLMTKYDKYQRETVLDAMNVAVTYVPVLERASQLIAELDVLASMAHVAAFSPHGYCKPEITDSEEDGFGIELKEARHPCVELQDNVDFIPNDFNLIYGNSSFLLVTGPNMGGKVSIAL
jgi:DNA mismatch repair protein MSH2